VRRLENLLMALLFGAIALPGWVGAAYVADQAEALKADESAEVWGDPDEESEEESTWTWFGMGYEQRNDMLNRQGAGSESNVRGGKGGSSK